MKKLKHSPVVAIQGARQTGKSFLARFEGVKPLIIDEAQKAPALFDAIKFSVNEDKVPGRFLLLGSTEFSLLQNIQESLTGRMGRVRLSTSLFRDGRDAWYCVCSGPSGAG